jgi:hypothetical protein
MDILIYVPKITPRINYTFRQVCKRILGFNISFTTKIETFIGFKGVKFSYANQRLGNEIFIQAHGLLNEQGVNDLEITVSEWEGNPYFFKTSNQSDIPYDIFAASFFLLTRYEEYLPHVKNSIGDFPAQESLGYQNNFLTKPIINIWMEKFAEVLTNKFEDVNFDNKKTNLKLIVAVERAYKYRKHGISRTIFGFISDTFRLKFKDLFIRIKTWFNPINDPYDIYNELITIRNKLGFEIFFMFQLGDYSIYTKNMNFRKRIYKKLIKSMGDYCEIGLMPSHEAIMDFDVLKKEIKRFEQIANHELTNIMIKDRGLNFPEFYVSLDKTDIKYDFSMGYHNQIGFRAGTYTPFLFYDLNLEQASPIQFHPYFCSTKALKSEEHEELERIIKGNKNLNIHYNLLFDNSDFAKNKLKYRILNLIKLILNA